MALAWIVQGWRWLCLTVALVAILGALGEESRADDNVVRVRLEQGQNKISFKAQNLVVIDRKGVRVDFSGEADWADFTVRWHERESESKMLAQIGKGGNLVEIGTGLQFPLEIRAQQIKFEDKLVPPHLWINLASGSYEVVAQLSMSDYLFGVLVREMPGAWPMEALKAQTVAARSYTLAQMRLRSGETFDLEGSVLDQDFQWISEDNRTSETHVRWQSALRDTDRWVLLNPDNEVLKAYYHADCGGQTTTPDLVWGTPNYYQSVKDSVCAARTENSWQTVVTKDSIRKQLAGGLEGLRAKINLQFDWVMSLFDGRVTLVEWWQSPDKLQLITGQNFRQIIGFSKLKSTRFKTEDLGDKIRFTGKGSGHGVGLCQWGAKDWAQQGWNAQKILNHYYPLARLVTLPESKKAELSKKIPVVASSKQKRPAVKRIEEATLKVNAKADTGTIIK